MSAATAIWGILPPALGVVLLMAAGLTEARSDAAIEARVARLERILEAGGLLDLIDRMNQLQAQVQRLQGQLDMQGHALDEIRERQRQLAGGPERRSTQSKPPGAAAPTGEAPPPGLSPPGPAAGVGPPETGSAAPPATPVPSRRMPATAGPPAELGEQESYERALGLLRDRRYGEAATAFQAYLQAYPQGEYAANAAYWLGEVDYVGGQPDEALAAFRKVLDDYPESSKVPDAMLKIGMIHADRGRTQEARQVLETLVSQYPDTTAARLAQERLQKLGAPAG
jgi:tol-pal system protein YbgF